MPSAAEFKEQAAIAWANGQFDEAIEQYTSALFKVADGSDKDLQKTLLSNRSAAYMKVGRTQAALTDAIKCVEIDETWAKGHSRKGDALYALGKLTEAYNAYNAGLMHSKDDASLKEKAEMTMHAIRNVATAAEGTANAGVATNPSAGGLLQSVQGVLKFLVIANGIVFALPFLNRVAPMNYKIFVIGAFTDFAIALYSTHGKPQFNMGYVQRVLPDPTLMYILMCIILFIGTPYFTSMIPILLLETAQFAYFVAQRGADRHGAVLERAGALVDKTVPRALGIVGWEHMTTSTKWSQFNVKVVEMCCMFEVTQGLMMIFQLLFPTRNVLFTVMWWQYLQMRYMMDQSGSIKRAFWAVDSKILTLLSYQICPGIVRTGYGKLRDLLAKQVQMPTTETSQGGGSGLLSGMMSKCTIS